MLFRISSLLVRSFDAASGRAWCLALGDGKWIRVYLPRTDFGIIIQAHLALRGEEQSGSRRIWMGR